ncbi:MAG: hypothetical protein ABII18_14045 [bacterium]|nr:hypothetical protein [bacterium]MBU1918403.1 hypothetical protein [bacterium]
MKNFIYTLVVIIVVSLLPLNAEAAVSKRYTKDKKSTNVKTEKVIRSEVGLNIQEWGIAIDAVYDPRLDNLVPGYHIVNLVVTNRSGDAIQLNTRHDRWYIIDSMGKKHTAYNHVKQFNEKLWPQLPKKMQDMLEYPHVVNPGKATNIDVFLPKSVDLHHFREVVWKSEHFNREFNVFTNYEKNLSLPNSKEFDANKKNLVDNQLKNTGSVVDPRFDEHNDALQKQAQQTTPTDLEINEIGSPHTENKEATVDGFIRVK